MTREEEIRYKHFLVRRFMAKNNLQVVALSDRANFAWFTAGGDNHVLSVSEHGVATILITSNRLHLLTNNIECPRILNEELPKGIFECHCAEWHDETGFARLLGRIVGKKRIASDDGLGGTPILPAEFAELRYSLTTPEVQRYRRLGRLASEAIESTAAALEPGLTEFQIAARLSNEVIARGVEVTVNLIAVDDRIRKYRHPIPTDKKLRRHAMLVLGARKWGLIVSCTRMVCFGKLSKDLARRHEAVCHVDAALNLSSRVGACVGDVFRKGLEMYRATGFPEEWRLHHQGGSTGYGARDYKGTPYETRCVQPNQAFAWNPSITGTKSEDTILATRDGVEFLSGPIHWPTLAVEYDGVTLHRPDILTL